MSNYKHGDWYCDPANEAEAREIIERALASGAELYESVGINYYWNSFIGWGVEGGRTLTSDDWRKAKPYTIEQVREKFPLPNEVNQQEEKAMPNNITHVLNKEFEERIKVIETLTKMHRKIMYEGYLLEYYVLEGWVLFSTLEDSVEHLNKLYLDLDTMESLTSNYRLAKAPSKPKPVYMVLRVPHASGKERATEVLTYKDSDSAVNAMRTGDAGAHTDLDCGYVLLTILENEIIQATIKNI